MKQSRTFIWDSTEGRTSPKHITYHRRPVVSSVRWARRLMHPDWLADLFCRRRSSRVTGTWSADHNRRNNAIKMPRQLSDDMDHISLRGAISPIVLLAAAKLLSATRQRTLTDCYNGTFEVKYCFCLVHMNYTILKWIITKVATERFNNSFSC